MKENPQRRTIILMVGLPRSGKSTEAKSFSPKHPIVSPDCVRLALHGQPYVQSAENAVWATVYLMVSSLFLAGHDYVVIDACNVTVKSRDKWKAYCDELAYIYIDTSMHTCLERATGNENLQNAIKRMAYNFEPLTDTEALSLWN